jgi:hypothetical protein
LGATFRIAALRPPVCGDRRVEGIEVSPHNRCHVPYCCIVGFMKGATVRIVSLFDAWVNGLATENAVTKR